MISYKKYGMHPEQPKNRDAPALLWHSPCTGLGSGQSESGLLRRKKPVDDYSLNGIYSDLMRIYNALIGYEWDTWRFSWDIRRPLPSLVLGGAAPGITVGVRHGLVPALASKPQNLRSSFRRRAACLAMVPP